MSLTKVAIVDCRLYWRRRTPEYAALA